MNRKPKKKSKAYKRQQQLIALAKEAKRKLAEYSKKDFSGVESTFYVRGMEVFDIPSLVSDNINKESTQKKTSYEYCGDQIVGIATTHKSNLVPVSKDTDPRDYSTMRRN